MCMWNEFEHVEDDRFNPNRDDCYGEYKAYRQKYDDEEYSSGDKKSDRKK